MSASQISAIEWNQPNLLGDGFYAIQTTLNVSSVSTLQTLTQFNDTIFLEPGGSSANIATMPLILDLADRTAHITNTGLNITTVDGDLLVNNGFIQTDTINVSTINYQSLNPPVNVAISSIVANNTIDIVASGYTSYINLSTGTNSGVNIINGNTTVMSIGSGVQMLLSDGLYISANGGGGGGQQIVQYPLVPIGANEYYNQSWNGIGGAGTSFIAGTINYGSYQLTSADGTVVVQNDLSVSGNASASNLTANNSITANTGSISSLNVSTLNYSYLNPAVLSLEVLATSSTPIELLPSQLGKTYVLTGTTTQPISISSLTVANAGYFSVVHNGNGQGGGDINLSDVSGTTIIHNRTATFNGQNVYLYWDGTTLTGY